MTDDTTHRYESYLSAMKKTEDSLKRLKKGKKPAFSLFGGSSSSAKEAEEGKDEERIWRQMMLDVEGLGREARALGVDIEGEGFGALRRIASAAMSGEGEDGGVSPA